MEVTLYCTADIVIFLNDKNEIVGYQLDDSQVRKGYFLPPIKGVPEGAKKKLPMRGVWSKITYTKDVLTDGKPIVVKYKINEPDTSICLQVARKLNLAEPIDGTGEKELCLGFTPINPTFINLSYDCTLCQNRASCQGEEVLCG